MKPELVQLAAQREEHGEPDERREHVAFLGDVVEGQHARGEQDAEAEERHGGRIDPQRRGGRPRAPTIADEGGERRSSRRGRAARARRARGRAAAGASGVDCHLGGDELVEEQRHQRHAGERRHRRGEQPRAEADLDAERAARSPRPSGLAAIAVSQSADDRLRLAMPENIRKRPEARRYVVARLRARRFGQREGERIEDAGAGGVARKGRRDERRPPGRCCTTGPSVDRPKTLTTTWPMRVPRPHFTTARATRNARTISRIVPFAKPA